MSDERDAVEGRVRGRPLIAGAVGLALLAALPIVAGLLSGDEPRPPGGARPPGGSPGEGAEEPASLHGRLVYAAAADRRPGEQRLWILDLGGDVVARGPAVPRIEHLYAGGPGRRWVVLVAIDGDERVAFLLRELATATEPVEVARGDLIAVSSDGTELLVADIGVRDDPACGEPAYRLRRVLLRTGREAPVPLEPPCGRPLSVGWAGGVAIVSLLRGGVPSVVVIPPGGEATVLFDELAHVAVFSDGTFLFVEPSSEATPTGSVPGAPTGPVLVWPGGGTPRPLVSGFRLTARRVLAWPPDGRYVVVDGVIQGERTLWLVDVAAGTAGPLLPRGYPFVGPVSETGATFDDDGNAFVGTPGRIIASTPRVLRPLALPAGAAAPAGPVAWLS